MTGLLDLTVRLPISAGPDSGVYHGVMPSELRCCSDRSDRFRLNEMLAWTTSSLPCKKDMTILCTLDHLLSVCPPIWAGLDRIKLFVLV